MRPDLRVVLFRGNVQTRLRKLGEGEVDGTLLANAGLKRLSLADVITDLMPLDEFPPAPGQGAICIETRSGDARTARFIAPLHDAVTAAALDCERAFLAALDGSCRTPIAGYAHIDGDRLYFSGMILRPDGRETHAIAREGAVKDAATIGNAAGETLRAKAGTSFFEGWT